MVNREMFSPSRVPDGPPVHQNLPDLKLKIFLGIFATLLFRIVFVFSFWLLLSSPRRGRCS